MDGLKNASSEFFALFVIHSPLSRRSLQIITCKVAITKRTAAYPMSEQKLVLQRAGGARGIGGHLPPPPYFGWIRSKPFSIKMNTDCPSPPNFQNFRGLWTVCSFVNIRTIKVHIFWEGHKILRNLHQLFILCTASQIIGGDFAKFCGLLRIYELYQGLNHQAMVIYHNELIIFVNVKLEFLSTKEIPDVFKIFPAN